MYHHYHSDGHRIVFSGSKAVSPPSVFKQYDFAISIVVDPQDTVIRAELS